MNDQHDGDEWLLRGIGSRLQLSLALPERSSEAARRAVASFGSHGIVEAALFAGSAVELLAKGLIAAKTPERLGAPSRLGRQTRDLLSDLPTDSVRSLFDMITLKFRDAIDAVCDLYELSIDTNDVDSLREARDAAVHLGHADPEHTIAAMGAMARIGRVLLTVGGGGLDEWIGSEDPHLAPALEALPRGAHRHGAA